MIDLADTVDLDVFRRYAGISLPRHVSYPMPSWWKDVDGDEASSMLRESDEQDPGFDLSLYLHIPFCETLCKFCACNRVIQRHDATGAVEVTNSYVSALKRDIRSLAGSIDNKRSMRQVHYGGGSPTYLSDEQLREIHTTLLESFALAPDAEVAMEVDPRNLDADRLQALHDTGIKRLSMGIQDFDEQVQKHIRRVQPFDLVSGIVSHARDVGFESINFDLIYGMPYQSPDTIRDVVDKTIELAPDRIAYYHYAQIPERIATQRGMDYTKLPDSETKLEMFLIGLERFEAAGYAFIGLDHFAKPDEGLSKALDDGSLQRNFQGMTTGGGLRLLGVGASAISQLPDVGFLQHFKDHAEYAACIDANRSPVQRGMRFSFDDRVRQAVLSDLYCTARLQRATIESRFDIDVADYFSREMTILRDLERDGLVTIDDNGDVEVTCPLGRVLIRNVAAVFDAYLDPEAYRLGDAVRFSANA